MRTKNNKSIIRIPTDITMIYSAKKNFLIIKGPLTQKSIELKLKVFINKVKKRLKVSSISCLQISNKERKKIKAVRGTLVALIKHKLIETSTIIQKKLKLHGVGYRMYIDEALKSDKLLTFKLGYSHFIYFKVPTKLTIFCFSKTKLCIFGNSFKDINLISAKIRSYKKPEPYKGKGILYENEKIVLKKGKKV